MLESYGLEQVQLESFPSRAWRPAREELAVLSPGGSRGLACRCGGLSVSTPDEGVEGRDPLFSRAAIGMSSSAAKAK